MEVQALHQLGKVQNRGEGTSGSGSISSEELNTLKAAIIAQNDIISEQNRTIADLRQDLTSTSEDLQTTLTSHGESINGLENTVSELGAGEVLYEDNTKTTTFTLSKSVNDYSIIEIFVRNMFGGVNSIKCNANELKDGLSVGSGGVADNYTYTYYLTAKIAINDKNATISDMYWLANKVVSGSASRGDALSKAGDINRMWVYKIVGYK